MEDLLKTVFHVILIITYIKINAFNNVLLTHNNKTLHALK